MAWDLYRCIKVGLTGTITYMFWKISESHPIIVYVAGIFFGHLFPAADAAIPVGLGCTLLGTSAWYGWKERTLAGTLHRLNSNPGLVFLAGYLTGFTFWSEKEY